MARKENGIYVVSDKLNVERYNMEGNIYSIIEELQSIREIAVDMGMVGEGDLDIDASLGYYDDDYGVVITYCFDRVENDKEKLIREETEAKVKNEAAKKRKAAAEKKKLKDNAEYVEFLRLKEKFGAL